MKAVNFILRKITIRKSTKDNKDYALKLMSVIERDVENNYAELKKYRKSISDLVNNPKVIRIEDEFLIVKSREHLEIIDETLKKSKRYRQKKIQTIKEAYECYNILNEMHTSKTVAKEYISQLNRHLNSLS